MRDWPQSVSKRFAMAVFLDRDGTLNKDTHFPYRLEELEVFPDAVVALRRLSSLPAHILVITNQAGIALGKYDVGAMSDFNRELRRVVEVAHGRIDAFYYCPHREAKQLTEGEVPCSCSKPAPGLLFEAARDFGVDLSRSFMVGDKPSDVHAGSSAGCKTIFLRRQRIVSAPKADFTTDTLLAAAHIISGLCHH